MLRNEIFEYAHKKFGTTPEYLWLKFPEYAVLRHNDNQKWYAIIMNVPKEKLGLHGDDKIDIINVKSDPLMIGSLTMQEGILPGYHLNKGNWISILLDGTVDLEQILWLIDISFKITGAKQKSKITDWLIPVNPRYYDVDAAITESPEKFIWKQSTGITEGNTVYLYITAPVSAIKYKCEAVKTNIPYRYEDENVSMKRIMELRLIQKYERPIPLSVLKQFGITTVRGPRGIPTDLIREMKKYGK